MTAKKKRLWKPKLGAALGPQEQKLYTFFQRHRITASVGDLFEAVMGGKKRPAPRMQQQKIGSIAARFNQKRRGMRIVPGDSPRTYRLQRVR